MVVKMNTEERKVCETCDSCGRRGIGSNFCYGFAFLEKEHPPRPKDCYGWKDGETVRIENKSW